MTASEKTIYPSSNCHMHKSNMLWNAMPAHKHKQTTKSYFMHTPGSVCSLLLHPLSLEFLPHSHLLLFVIKCEFDGAKIALQNFVSGIYGKIEDRWNTITLFVTFYSLAPRITISMSVHQISEEKGLLISFTSCSRHNLQEQSPPLSVKQSPCSPYVQNPIPLLRTFQHQKLPRLWTAHYLLFYLFLLLLRKPSSFCFSLLPTHEEVLHLYNSQQVKRVSNYHHQ